MEWNLIFKFVFFTYSFSSACHNLISFFDKQKEPSRCVVFRLWRERGFEFSQLVPISGPEQVRQFTRFCSSAKLKFLIRSWLSFIKYLFFALWLTFFLLRKLQNLISQNFIFSESSWCSALPAREAQIFNLFLL